MTLLVSSARPSATRIVNRSYNEHKGSCQVGESYSRVLPAPIRDRPKCIHRWALRSPR